MCRYRYSAVPTEGPGLVRFTGNRGYEKGPIQDVLSVINAKAGDLKPFSNRVELVNISIILPAEQCE